MGDLCKKKFIMEVKEVRVTNNTVGYFFILEKLIKEEMKQVY